MDKKDRLKGKLTRGQVLTELEKIRDRMLEIESRTPTKQQIIDAFAIQSKPDEHDEIAMTKALETLNHSDELYSASDYFMSLILEHLEKNLIIEDINTADEMTQYISNSIA